MVHDVRDFVGAETYCVTGGHSIGLVSGQTTSMAKPASAAESASSATTATTITPPPRGASLGRRPKAPQRQATLMDVAIVKGVVRGDNGVAIEVMDGGRGESVDDKNTIVSTEERRKLFLMLLKVYLGIKDR